MALYRIGDDAPRLGEGAWVADSATVLGRVELGEGANVWYGAVLRGDEGPIIVRADANVQDLSLIHCGPGVTTEIGARATIAHQCVVHGAVIEEEALVANGCVVLDGARVGAGSLIAALSLVGAGVVIPPGVLAAGSPAVVKRPLAGTAAEMWVKINPTHYPELARRHRAGLTSL